jgi:hypothetical protein
MTPNADSGGRYSPYVADWLDDERLPHRGVYCVRSVAGNRVICTTNSYKDGWERAQSIAAAMNEKARREGGYPGVPTNV